MGRPRPPFSPPLHEKQFAFSLRTSLSDDERQDALYSLLARAGCERGQRRTASYAEVMVKMRIKGDVLEDLSGKVAPPVQSRRSPTCKTAMRGMAAGRRRPLAGRGSPAGRHHEARTAMSMSYDDVLPQMGDSL